MLLHIKYLVYTKTTAGVAGGGRGGGCNLHSCFLPQQLAACQPLRKLLNQGLARVWLQGWSGALSSDAATLSQALCVAFIIPSLLLSSSLLWDSEDRMLCSTQVCPGVPLHGAEARGFWGTRDSAAHPASSLPVSTCKRAGLDCSLGMGS